jgi:glutaredoxin
MLSSVRLAALTAVFGCAAMWSASASAQVFRIVGPDGRVTFSDRPPAESNAAAAKAVPLPSAAPAGGVQLPLAVRNAIGRYPVTLYSAAECGPCTQARGFLSSRGIPFSEKTISTEEDVAALQRLSGGNQLPFATIGGQQLRGFSDTEWSQYLDAAGYPKTSQLPPNYRNAPASPLVAVQRPTVPQQQQQQQQAQRPQEAPPRAEAEPSGPGPSNPAGIRF